MSLLDVIDLSIRFGSTEVVSGMGFSVQRGERFGIIGTVNKNVVSGLILRYTEL